MVSILPGAPPGASNSQWGLGEGDASSHLPHLHTPDAKCISTPSLPSPKHCTKKPCVHKAARPAAPHQKIHSVIPPPSCHRGSNSSFQLGQGLLNEGAAFSRSTGEWGVLETATPTRQVGRDMPRLAPGTRGGHTPGSCCSIRCSPGRNWDYV